MSKWNSSKWRWDRIIAVTLLIGVAGGVVWFRLACAQIIAHYDMISNQINTALPPYEGSIRLNNRNLIIPSWKYIDQNRIWSYVSSNKPIEPSYVPADLVPLVARHGEWLSNKTIRQVALNDIGHMFAEASMSGVDMIITSAYRTEEDQEHIYIQSLGSGFATPPSYSEHQTGLALDITTYTPACQEAFMDCALVPETIDWLKNNSYRFGFILRYPEDKTAITNVPYEPWHYRYVGRYLAKFLYRNGLTFDEISVELINAYNTRNASIK